MVGCVLKYVSGSGHYNNLLQESLLVTHLSEPRKMGSRKMKWNATWSVVALKKKNERKHWESEREREGKSAQ